MRYKFEVAGRHYTGDRASNKLLEQARSTPEQPPPSEWLSLCDRYGSGSPASIHYNPANPRQSYVHYLPSSGVYETAVLGGVFLLAGILLFSSS